MTRFIFCFSFLLVAFNIHAQKLSQSLIGSAGSVSLSLPSKNVQITFSIGEAVITNNSSLSNAIVVTHGFHQPNIIIDTPPKAGFNINSLSQCLTNNSFQFNDTSVYNGNLIYSWDFGDGTKASIKSPGHTYNKSGIYKITVTVTAKNGLWDTASQSLEVYPMPNPNFSVNNDSQCLVGNNFSFTNASSISGNSSLTYKWDFGDGTTSTVKSPSHTYYAAGVYSVKLKAYSLNQCVDSVIKDISIFTNPTAKFTASGFCLYEITQFNFTGTTVSNTLYFWDFGDGYLATTKNPQHQYTKAGKYQVSLVIKQPNSCADSVTQTIELLSVPPADFSVIDMGSGNYKFIPVNKNASRYYWDFGDGDTSSTMSPLHTYGFNGKYIVRLITFNSIDCSDTSDQTVNVNIVGIKEFNNNAELNIYPNPFNSETTVTYTLRKPANDISIVVYDITGKNIVIKELANQLAGKHVLKISANELQLVKGIYFVCLKIDENQYFRKVIIQ